MRLFKLLDPWPNVRGFRTALEARCPIWSQSSTKDSGTLRRLASFRVPISFAASCSNRKRSMRRGMIAIAQMGLEPRGQLFGRGRRDQREQDRGIAWHQVVVETVYAEPAPVRGWARGAELERH